MDDVAEQQEIANEISEAISNPVGFGTDVDEVINWVIFSITEHSSGRAFGIILSAVTKVINTVKLYRNYVYRMN